ncbi:MAG: ATP-binding cassette domain-containing protein [Gammaproteobacteria bacterium]
MTLQLLDIKTRRTLSYALDRECTVGSDTRNKLVIGGEGVALYHARIFTAADGEIFIEPVANALLTVNGKLLERATHLTSGDWVLFGFAPYQITFSAPLRAFHDTPPPPSEASENALRQVILTGRSTLIIGRLPHCGLAIPSPLISREHAKLIREPSGWFIEDHGSTNGTFLNARRIQGRQPLHKYDRLGFAAFEYEFDGESLVPAQQTGQVAIDVYHLSKEVRDASGKPKRLLDDLSFAIHPGEFVGIFGTSGSGKSTLLDALNGRRPATAGRILYNGTDLYGAFDLFRTAIGYVPQQDIVHRKIIMQHALKYTAKLRLPPDTSDLEMDDNVLRVLDKVGLAEKASLAVDTPTPLSGGQLKRVSLAVELVANPNVLFLDEVTSGLDAGTDKKMMQLFRNLAEDQKTVVCITHTLENIDTCHLVLLLHQGRLVFFGPPQAVVGHFNIQRLSEVYDLLESRPAAFWADKFKASDFYKTYVQNRLQLPDSNHTPSTTVRTAPHERRARFFDWRQTKTLMLRYLELILCDRRNLSILILQAPLIALIIGLVFEMDAEIFQRAAQQNQVAFILVLSAIWFGCLNSARELVKELPIYLRERSVNLALGPYVISKLLPLAALCMLQCLLLLGVIAALLDIPGDWPLRFAVLFAAGMSATAMGLCVSAFVNSNDKAVATIPILLIPQVILSGAVVKLKGAGLWIAKLSIIAYWAFDAMKLTFSEDTRALKDPAGNPVLAINGTLHSDLLALAVLGLLFLTAAGIGLKLKDKNSK